MISNTQLFETLLREWNTIFEFPCYAKIDEVPLDTIKLRFKLIDEEAREYYAAKERIDELDAICDLLYVIIGTNVTCGVPVESYSSGQRAVAIAQKQPIYTYINPILTELGSLFPCPRLTNAYTNRAIQRLVDAAIIRGFKIRDAFVAVHRNNMEKLWNEPPDGTIYNVKRKGNKWLIKNEYGKVIKPPNHTKVDLTPFI